MPLPPIITTINTRLLLIQGTKCVITNNFNTTTTIPTPISTPSRIPTPISTPSRIPTPILDPLKKRKRRSSLNIKNPSTDPLDNIKKPSTDTFDNIKPSSKVSYDDNNDDIDDILYNYRLYNPGPGTRTVIIPMENHIKNTYDSINYLQNKLLNTENYDERNKIIDDIELAKNNYLKKKKN